MSPEAEAERPRYLPEHRFVCSPMVDAVSLGAQTVLFCGRTEQLSELNETAALIWRGVAAGCTFAAVSQQLQDLGATPQQAEAFVSQQVSEWLRLGYLIPEEILALSKERPAASLNLSIDELNAELRFFGNADAGSTLPAFTGIRAEEGGRSDVVRLSVIGEADVDYLLLDDVPLGMAHRRNTLPTLKYRLTRELFRRATAGFFTHGALVSRAGKSVFLAGEPGAGKSTLTLALVGEGFAYGGDDTVRVGPNGAMKGLPLAAAVKDGAWRLLAADYPDLASLDIHEREDGLMARYIVPSRLDLAGFRPIDIFLQLGREAGARAHLAPITPLDALGAIIKGGYTERPLNGAVDVMRGLARCLSAARCHRLVYDDLADAVTLIKAAASD